MKLLKTALVIFAVPLFTTAFFSSAAFAQNYFTFMSTSLAPSGKTLAKVYTLDTTDPVVANIMTPMNQQVQQAISALGPAATQDQIDQAGYQAMSQFMNNFYNSNPDAIAALDTQMRAQMLASDGSLNATLAASQTQCAEFTGLGYAGAIENGLTPPQIFSVYYGADSVPHMVLAVVNSEGTPTMYNMAWPSSLSAQDWATFMGNVSNPLYGNPELTPVDVAAFVDPLEAAMNGVPAGGIRYITPGTPLWDPLMQQVALSQAQNTAATTAPASDSAAFDFLDSYGNPMTADEMTAAAENLGTTAKIIGYLAEQFPGIAGFVADNASTIGTGLLYLQAFGLAVQEAQLFAAAIQQGAQAQYNFGGVFALWCNNTPSCASADPAGQLSQAITLYNSSANTDPGQGTVIANPLYNPGSTDGDPGIPANEVKFNTLTPANYPACDPSAIGCYGMGDGSSISAYPDGSSLQKWPSGQTLAFVNDGTMVPGTDYQGGFVYYPEYTMFLPLPAVNQFP